MKLLSLLIILSIPFILPAQGVFNNNINAALQKVIQDYPNRFKNIRGEQFSADVQSTSFVSKIGIPEAAQCLVIQNSVSKNDMYSWKCTLEASKNFEQAADKFQVLFNQIENSIIKIEGEKPFILSGTYENPVEQNKVTIVSFGLLPNPMKLQKLKVELALLKSGDEWKIMLLVYNADYKPADLTNLTKL